MGKQSGAPKGISFGYQTFLWQGIGLIRKFQIEGDFGTALKMCVTFVPYLPDKIKNKFRERANRIMNIQNDIALGKIEQLRKIPDIFQRQTAQTKVLTQFSAMALQSFIDDLSTELDKEGYFIPTKEWEEGYMDTWQDMVEQMKDKRQQQ